MIDYVKDTYGNTSNRIQSVELKFKKELARLNEQEPNEDDVVQTPDLIITVQLSQPLNPKLRVRSKMNSLSSIQLIHSLLN